MVIIASQRAKQLQDDILRGEQSLVFLRLIKHAETVCKKTREQQSIDRLECSEIARNCEYNSKLSEAFQVKFYRQIEPNPNNQWARLLWFGLALSAQNNIIISAQDLQAARPNQTFENLLDAPPIEPVQIINLCFDYSPTVLYDLQLLISFYSSIINS